jgi:hypothetical protein
MSGNRSFFKSAPMNLDSYQINLSGLYLSNAVEDQQKLISALMFEKSEIQKKFDQINKYRNAVLNPKILTDLKKDFDLMLESEKLRDQMQTAQTWIKLITAQPSQFSHFINFQQDIDCPQLPEPLSLADGRKKNLSLSQQEKAHMEDLQDFYSKIIDKYIEQAMNNKDLNPKRIIFTINFYYPILEKYVSDKILKSLPKKSTESKNLEAKKIIVQISSLLTNIRNTKNNRDYDISYTALEDFLKTLTSKTFTHNFLTTTQVDEVLEFTAALFENKDFSHQLKAFEALRTKTPDKSETGLFYAMPNEFSKDPFLLAKHKDPKIREYYQDQAENLRVLRETFLFEGMEVRLRAKQAERESDEQDKQIEIFTDELYDALLKKDSMAIKTLLNNSGMSDEDQEQILALCGTLFFQQPLSLQLRNDREVIEDIFAKNKNVLSLFRALTEYVSPKPNVESSSLQARYFHELMNLSDNLAETIDYLEGLRDSIDRSSDLYIEIVNPIDTITPKLLSIDNAIQTEDKKLVMQFSVTESTLVELLQSQIMHAAALYYNRKKSFTGHHDAKVEDPIVLDNLQKILACTDLTTLIQTTMKLLKEYSPYGLHTNSLDTFLMQVLYNEGKPRGFFALTESHDLASVLNHYSQEPLHVLQKDALGDASNLKQSIKSNAIIPADTVIQGTIAEAVRGSKRKPVEDRGNILKVTFRNFESLLTLNQQFNPRKKSPSPNKSIPKSESFSAPGGKI